MLIIVQVKVIITSYYRFDFTGIFNEDNTFFKGLLPTPTASTTKETRTARTTDFIIIIY